MCFTKYFIQIALVLVVCVCASAQQKPAGGSVIKGRVIYADTGQPLRRATVSLIAQDEGWIADTFSDRNGEFLFNDVNAGKYFVVVSALDIVSPFAGKDTLKLKIALGQITDGFSEETVDGRSAVKTEIRASRGGVITGRVLTESDEPIAKARLTLFQIEHGKLRLVASRAYLLEDEEGMLETDSRGVYRLTGLATGEYIVRASESNEGGKPDDAADGSYTDGSMMVAFYPKALRVQDATSVKVQQGSETADVDIHFTEQIAHRVSGTVLLRGKPISSIELKLTRDEPDAVNRSPFESAQARSDDKGQWEMRTVPDGRYTLLVSGGFDGVVSIGEGQGFVSVAPQERELIVEGGDVTNLNVEVFPEARVAGIVSVEGGARLPERMVIKLDPIEVAPSLNKLEHRGGINGKGELEVRQLPPGTFMFSAIPPAGYYVKSITLNGQDLLRNPIKLEAGQLLTGVKVMLSTEVVSLSARVVRKDDRSKPLSNATVMLIPAEAERRRMIDQPTVVITDKDGRFAMKSPPGEYFVMVAERRRNVAVEIPSEASLVKNTAGLQKINLQRGDEKKVVELVGP